MSNTLADLIPNRGDRNHDVPRVLSQHLLATQTYGAGAAGTPYSHRQRGVSRDGQ